MESTTAKVVLFAFHDARRVAAVVDAAVDHPGVRSVAVVGRSADCELRIIGRVGSALPDVRSLASTLAVLDALSSPLCVVAGAQDAGEAVTLPDSVNGYAAFGRLVPPGALVILLAVCDEQTIPISSFERELGSALFRRPTLVAPRLTAVHE